MKTIRITCEQNKMVRAQLESHTQAIKNWMASAVEREDHLAAKQLVVELRAYQEMFHIFVPDDMFKDN